MAACPPTLAGDKQPNFVGSSQWIGSMEIGYYLDEVLGVTWRNIFVTTGPELADKVRPSSVTGSKRSSHMSWRATHSLPPLAEVPKLPLLWLVVPPFRPASWPCTSTRTGHR